MGISAALFHLLRNNKKFNKIESSFTDKSSLNAPFEPSSHKGFSLHPGATIIVPVAESLESPLDIIGMTLSASGRAKFSIVKNNVVLATLFNGDGNWQLYYPHKISLKRGDGLELHLTNKDLLPQDIYVGFDVEIPKR